MSKEEMKLALKRAFQLGQDYWYQADHESYSQNKKSDATRAKFEQLVDDTCEALAKQEQGEPVAHCAACPQYCWKCNEEMKPTYGSEEIRKLREVNKRLADHIPDAKKMVEALREIGDFAHDKSTGPTVPDALWEIRSIAYNAIVEFELMMNISTPQPKQEQGETDYAYKTIEEYEEIVGFEVGQPFKMGWAMARTTNDLFKQMSDQMEKDQ